MMSPFLTFFPNSKAEASMTMLLLLLAASSVVVVTPFVTTTTSTTIPRIVLPKSASGMITRTDAPALFRTSILAFPHDDDGMTDPAASKGTRTMGTNLTSSAPVLLVSPPPTTLAYQAPINGDANVPATPKSVAKKMPFPLVVWKFTRPHTLIGSAMAIPSITMLAAPSYGALMTSSSAIIATILYAMVPSLLMNLYITGLNQVTDVEIDTINKPYLPIPAGLLSRKNAIIVCVVALVTSLLLGVAHPVYGTQGLNVALWGSAILGTIYSLKPFRLKRHPFLAAFCIVAVRGTVINAGFYAHAKAAAYGASGATGVWSLLTTDRRSFLSSAFFAVFGLVIALMKDVPDVLGDRLASIRTFSVRVGPQRIFHFSRRVLGLLLYFTAGAFATSALSKTHPIGLMVTRLVVAACSMAAGVSVAVKAAGVDPESPDDVYSYYMHLWKIFYASYLLLPLAR